MTKVAIGAINPNPVAMRSVNRESEAYQGLVASIKRLGQVGAIAVRQRESPYGETYYEIIDGLHRYQAMKDAGIDWVDVEIHDLDDGQILETQIMRSIHKIETKPVEYTRQLKRILSRNPLMTESELSSRLGKSPAWLRKRLSLDKLDISIAKLVDDGRINLSNAYALAKLPVSEQPAFVDQAMNMRPDEFIPIVNRHIKAIRTMRRQLRERNSRGYRTNPCYEQTLTQPTAAEVKKSLESKESLKNEVAKLKHFFEKTLEAETVKAMTHDDVVIATALATQKHWIKKANEQVEIPKSASELLHGKKERKPAPLKRTTTIVAANPIIRKGWDNVRIEGRIAYVSGDILVQFTGRWWIIHHPELKTENWSFKTPEEAMKLVEKHFWRA